MLMLVLMPSMLVVHGSDDPDRRRALLNLQHSALMQAFGQRTQHYFDAIAEPGRDMGVVLYQGLIDPVAFAAPGTPPLMYHCIGLVRADKSHIRHRVFSTRLKEGCAAEYKRRHDALIAARGDKITEGPESNFTIWNANGYIFGYCELVRAYDHEMTADERASTIAWETRQLEIMDWLTDDVDWMTGEHHEHIACLAIG